MVYLFSSVGAIIQWNEPVYMYQEKMCLKIPTYQPGLFDGFMCFMSIDKY